jgi:hypothetical protein
MYSRYSFPFPPPSSDPWAKWVSLVICRNYNPHVNIKGCSVHFFQMSVSFIRYLIDVHAVVELGGGSQRLNATLIMVWVVGQSITRSSCWGSRTEHHLVFLPHSLACLLDWLCGAQ